MTKSPGNAPEGDPLEPVLQDVEAELKRRLREACEAEATGVSNQSTSEVRQLEDTLLAAAVAAGQSVELRRHIARRQSTAQSVRDSESSSSEQSPPTESEKKIMQIREFRDATGQLWRAWPVTPGQARHGRAAHRYLGEFHKGWICFEALESNARRRLPQQPADWAELPESELAKLLEQAISAPERKSRSEPDRKRSDPQFS